MLLKIISISHFIDTRADNDPIILGLFLLLATTSATSPLDCSSLPARVLLHEAHLLSLPASALPGTWVSTECETRPGPQFVLRRYTFHGGNSSHLVTGVVYHYADPSCSQPIHSITMQGRVTVREPSWIVPGATQADFQLLHAWVRPYMKDVALKTQKKISKICPELGGASWRTGDDYSVFTEGGKEDCLAGLNLAFWEFQLFRLERGLGGEYARLQLGDLHSHPGKRRQYRPTAYQPHHLVKYNKHHHTLTGRLVHNSSPRYPPTLSIASTIPVTHTALAGSWHSTRCEVRPHSLFITRMITFSKGNQWHGVFNFFLDHFCSKKHFSVNVTGRYIRGKARLFTQQSTDEN